MKWKEKLCQVLNMWTDAYKGNNSKYRYSLVWNILTYVELKIFCLVPEDQNKYLCEDENRYLLAMQYCYINTVIVGSDSFVTHMKEVKSSVYHSGKHQPLHCIHIQVFLQKKDVCEGFLRRKKDLNASIT